jgi:hypothetical protein
MGRINLSRYGEDYATIILRKETSVPVNCRGADPTKAVLEHESRELEGDILMSKIETEDK